MPATESGEFRRKGRQASRSGLRPPSVLSVGNMRDDKTIPLTHISAILVAAFFLQQPRLVVGAIFPFRLGRAEKIGAAAVDRPDALAG